MTRARKVDPHALRNEYVFSPDPDMSITKVAEKYGLARSGVAQKARDGKWYEARQEFLANVNGRTMEILTEDWAQEARGIRRRMLELTNKTLDRYETWLNDDSHQITPADAARWIAIGRQVVEDISDSQAPNMAQVGDDELDMSYDKLLEVMASTKALLSGEEPDDTDEPDPAAAPATEPGRPDGAAAPDPAPVGEG